MHDPDRAPPPTAPEAEAPSKTRRKQAMHALQDLGEALVALDARRLAALDLPERLVDAITEARGIRAHEGRRRQIQFIGKLMRDVDPAPIRAALEGWASGRQDDHARFAAVERWRDALLADDGAFARFAAAHPGADHAALTALVRDARAERVRGGPPHRFRALFRALREAVAVAGDATGTAEPHEESAR